jgi:hypothetical protein
MYGSDEDEALNLAHMLWKEGFAITIPAAGG